MKKIITIGDSHAGYWGGWNKIEIDNISITLYGVPSQLMYSWARDKNTTCKEKIPRNGYAIFALGEIDCRNHIHKYTPDWEENIENLLEMYFENVKRNIAGTNCQPIIYNVNPHLTLEDQTQSNPVPRVGSKEDIKKYTLYMNEMKKKKSSEEGFIFLDTHQKYCNEDGFLLAEYSDGICHVSDPVHNKKWLEDFFGIKS